MQEREILFRGKRKDDDEWIISSGIKQSIYFVPHLWVEGRCYDRWEAIYPNTLGRYTGLTDKNGKKIFEGDILHFKAYRGGGFVCPVGTDIYYRVLFGHCNPDMNILTEYVGFWALGEYYDEDDLYDYGKSISYLVNSHGACVIGNIHDNPELIKE